MCSPALVPDPCFGRWVYTINGRPVDAATLTTLADDDDGNGPYVRVFEPGDLA
jgi:hypothetical protein